MSDDVGIRLQGEFDASVWAREFVAIVAEHPDVPTSEGAMLGWFANAIMAGYDRGRDDERARAAQMVAQASGEEA